ncbi:MAG: DUF2178 domain-containing protein [Sedimentisphaerales bacterium]|nr:DUF2178 domain-containing protein [Sedimentisphaerales bacterium]
MNRAQKNAISALMFLFVTNTIFAYMFFQLFILKKAPESFAGRFLPLAILILTAGALLVWTLKRQSPREVKADERDKLIDNRAAGAAFISALIVFLAVSGIPRFVLGDNGCVPAWSLPLINLGAFTIVAMIYFAAILIQYSGRDKGEKL